jgi:drug/metabolite transporter (DMT)-like permease
VSRARGRWLTAAGALCIAFAPVIFTLSGAPASLAALLRFAYALPLVAIACALRPEARGAFRSRSWLGFALAGGAFFAADILLWHRVIGLIGAGPATLLVNTQVIWVTLLGVAFLGEWPARSFWWALAPLALGMTLLSGASPRGFAIPDGGLGLALGIGSGAAYGAALLCLREASRRAPVPAESVLLVQLAGALLVAALAVGAEARGPALAPAQHAWLVALAAGPQVLGWFLINSGIRRIPAYEGALMLVLQPVASVALAWWILGQGLSPPRIAGAVLLLGAVVLALRSTRAPA